MFRLSNYWALGLLILIPYAFYLSKKSLADLSLWRRWLAFGLRSTIILLLVLSLAGFQLVWKVDKLCVIFALDMSNSIPEGEIDRASDFIRKTVDSMPETDEAGLIVFGKEAYVEIPPASKPEIGEISPFLSREYTNPGLAAKTAMDLFPEASQKKIVLITDGNENMGSVMDEAVVAKHSGVQIYTVPLSTNAEGSDEVLMDGLVGPGSAEIGRTFNLRAIVESTTDQTARLKLFRDRDYLAEEEVSLSATRKNVFTFPQSLETEGSHIYEVLVEPELDAISENNRAKALVITAGKPKILYIARNSGETDYLYQTLLQKGLEVNLLDDPSEMPTDLSEMQTYSTVILNDIPADSLSAIQMEMMDRYVHDLGGGFVMIGGENSFGSGGYYKTPVEELLPVKMIPDRKKRSLSIVLAIDTSGSMASLSGRYVKIDLAKEAAVSVVEFLSDKDQIGIIAFDAEAKEVFRLAKIKSKAKIEDRIASIQPSGGTNIYSALDMAHEWLRNADTQLKHVILVSDGKSQQTDESYDLARKMAQDKITLSTVAIGSDADREVMRNVADLGLGRYYETNDAGSLPRIFVKEAFVASKLVMEGNFRPIVSGYNEILKGIVPNSLPTLLGYVATSPKDNASVPVTADAAASTGEVYGDPILATWSYGLGKSVAFTSDARPKWAIQWLGWDNFSKFWSQAVGWSLAVPSGEFDVAANIVGTMGSVVVDAVDSEGRFRNFLTFQAKVISPDMDSETISLNQSGPGRYEAEFNAGRAGTYLLNVSEIRDGKTVNSRNTGAVSSYSPEYRDLKPDHDLLNDLANVTGGKFEPRIEEITAHGEMRVWRLQDLWRSLVLACIPLFFLDVALRRITVSREQVSELRSKFRLPAREASTPAPSETIASLKRLKEETLDVSAVMKRDADVEKTGRPSPEQDLPDETSTAKSEGSYTSRLLKAKKRADQSRDTR